MGSLLLLLTLSDHAWATDRGAILAEAWLAVEDGQDLQALQRQIGFTVSEGRRRTATGWEQRVLLSPRAQAALASRKVPLRITTTDHRKGPPGDGYHSPDEGHAVLEALASAHEHAGYAVVGTSSEGRDIGALWVGQPPQAGAPTLRVLGAHHGDEWSSFEVALATAKALADAYGEDDALTALLDEQTVWIVPFVNPDGVWAGSRYSATDVDLNRNYDFEWSATAYRPGSRPFSEPETRAMRDLAMWTLPHASLSLHSGAANIGYVWNWSTEPTADEELLVSLADEYVGRCTTDGFYATNGADWYITYGDTNDWSYGRYGGLDFTVELSNQKAPDASLIDVFVAEHLEATLAFLRSQAEPHELLVRTPEGAPLPARILSTERDWEGATHPATGRFARPLDGGSHILSVHVPGAEPTDVVVGTGDADTGVARRSSEVPIMLTAAWTTLPEPRVVSSRTEVVLPDGVQGPLTLWRAGAAPEVLDVDNGVMTVEPNGLAPGWWSVWEADGIAGLPHALFVDSEAVVDIGQVTVSGTTVTVEATGLATGTRAYAVTGPHRTMSEIDADTAGTSLFLDLGGVDSTEPVDLVLVSNGSEEVILDVLGAPWFDTGGRSDTASDTGPDPEPDCGCRSASPSLMMLLCIPLVWRRRLG